MRVFLHKDGNSLIFVTVLLLAAVWNIPHSMALRNFAIFFAFVSILWCRPSWHVLGKWWIGVAVFFAYVIIHALVSSPDFNFLFQNYRKDWLRFFLLSFLGAGVGLLLGGRAQRNFLLYLGAAFSLPLILHLMLFASRGLATGAIPWGYWGISETHGDFAYASLQATIILSCYLVWQADRRADKLVAVLLLFVCVLSPLFASSRGGVIFVALAVASSFMAYYFFRDSKDFSVFKIFLILAGLLIALAGLFRLAEQMDPSRWNSFFPRFSIGFQGDPLVIICQGVSELRAEMEQKGIVDAHTSKMIEGVNGADGSRIMTARAGLRLLSMHPWGFGGSRHAYQIAINQVCDPAIKMSHTHNGWIDTALAIGVPGAVLLLVVMLIYLALGFQAMRANSEIRPFGAVLFILVAMWTVRALLDATLTDQMLEMQAFTFALLAGWILMARKNRNEGDA